MTRCADRQARQALEQLFRGELDETGFTWLRAHASGCAGCREAYDKLARVESSLEQRVLPASREALLEKALFARLEGARQAERPTGLARFMPPFFLQAALGAVAAAVLVVVLVPRLTARPTEPEYLARGLKGSEAWGLRAFCVGPEGEMKGEALPGGVLRCAEGSSVQLTYTAPEGARLQVLGTSPSGEPIQFFPLEGGPTEVAPGADVLLPYSTPVQGGWLSGPLEVEARFTDAQGKPLARSRVTLTPQ
jgi:hypothetical protein